MNTSTGTYRMVPTVSIALAFTLAMLLGVLTAAGASIQGQYTNDPTHCDNVPDITLTHELGDAAVFPVNEQLNITLTKVSTVACVSDDGIANDWNVRIINLGSVFWEDVFFVADEGVDFSQGNWDGFISDLTAPFGAHAFRIDAVGSNNNLLSETMTPDGIFEPGEVWEFLVSNFDGPNTSLSFDSVGKFALSSASGPPSTASILANPVPEPATMALLGFGGLALIRRRRL